MFTADSCVSFRPKADVGQRLTSAPHYRLEQGKPLQDGPKTDATPDMPLLGIAADALAAWPADTTLTEGPIFRWLWGNTVGLGLPSEAIADIVQKRAQLAAGTASGLGAP